MQTIRHLHQRRTPHSYFCLLCTSRFSQLTMLTSVSVVCRDRPSVDALRHVAQQLDEFLDYSPRWSFLDAAEAGHLHLLQHLVQTQESSSQDSLGVSKKLVQKAMRVAARHNHVHIMEWIHATWSPFLGCGKARRMLNKAVAYGQVEAADWIDSTWPSVSCEPAAIVQAVRCGHLPVIQWIVRRRRLDWIVVVGFFDPVMDAVACGQLELVQWLLRWTNVPRRVDYLHKIAQERGHEEMAQWLLSGSAEVKGESLFDLEKGDCAWFIAKRASRRRICSTLEGLGWHHIGSRA